MAETRYFPEVPVLQAIICNEIHVPRNNVVQETRYLPIIHHQTWPSLTLENLHPLLLSIPRPRRTGDPEHRNRIPCCQGRASIQVSRDPHIRAVALDQLTDTVKKRARYLDPNKPEHLSEFLNTSALPVEGGAGDMQSIWSQCRDSLATVHSANTRLSNTPH